MFFSVHFTPFFRWRKMRLKVQKWGWKVAQFYRAPTHFRPLVKKQTWTKATIGKQLCLTVQECNTNILLLVLFQMGLWRSLTEFNVLFGPTWSSIGIVQVHRAPPSRLCSSPTLKRMETPICWGHWLEPSRISGNVYYSILFFLISLEGGK